MQVNTKLNKVRPGAGTGAGTIFLEVGAHVRREAPENFGADVGPLHFFGSKRTIRRFGELYCDRQYSLVSLLFAVLLLAVPPPYPAICKRGEGRGTCPPALWSRRHCGHSK